jgi:hypothetical protein
MRIQHALTLVLVGVLGVALTGPAAAQSTAPQTTPAPQVQAPAPPSVPLGKTFEGIFRLGGVGSSTDGNLNRVGEYNLLESTANLATEFWGNRGGTYYDVDAFFGGDARSQRYVADLDVNRFVKVHASYIRYPHRLDHDPLTYMDSVSTIGGTFAVKSDDTDPGGNYAITQGEWNGNVEVRLPAGVNFFLGHRMQTRDGTHQVMTIAHCSTCHTTAYFQRMDEVTRDIVAGAKYATGPLAIEYRFVDRNFKDDAATLTHLYDKAQHPAQLTDVFLGRVQYDIRDGALPFAVVPEVEKSTHHLRAGWTLPNQTSVQGTFTRSESRNKDVDLSSEYTGVTGRVVVPFGSRLTFRADLRRYEINADSIFIDVVEPVTPAGPNAGLTYVQAYPIMAPIDFVRESALSRSPTELGAELLFRPLKRTYLRFGYEWEQVERETFDVEKTTTSTLTFLARSQVGKDGNLRFRFQYQDTQDPFVYEHSAVPQVLQPFPSPGNVPFTGLQYDTMYDSRQGNLTAFPTKALRIEPTFTWSPGERSALTAHYRFYKGENDDLNFSTWERQTDNIGFDAWVAPGERWTLSAGYQYQKEKLETLFSTLAFIG